MRKQIAGALVASLLIGSAPGWADEDTTRKPSVEQGAQRQQFRESVDRAIGRATAETASAPELTAGERGDLETRQAALRTDPVARGAGGVMMALVGTALSIGLTMYLIKKTKDSTTIPSMTRP